MTNFTQAQLRNLTDEEKIRYGVLDAELLESLTNRIDELEAQLLELQEERDAAALALEDCQAEIDKAHRVAAEYRDERDELQMRLDKVNQDVGEWLAELEAQGCTNKSE